MAIYEVELKEIEIYTLKVEANSEEEAIEKALEELESACCKANYHTDSDYEKFAREIY